MRRPSLPLGAFVLALLVAIPISVGPARATDVHGDDARDRYVGTGGLVLPGTVDTTTRRQVAECGDCDWRLSSPCVASVLGNAFGDGCLSVVRGCPGGTLLRTWFRDGPQPWRDLGLMCVGPGGPVTVATVGGAARDRVERGIPPAAPAFLPAHGVLAQLPVRFASGQRPGDRHWSMQVLGTPVSIVAHPGWDWDFGDGSRLHDSDQGMAEHVYRRSDVFSVACTTTWAATYTVDGLGPFPVPEPVTQVWRGSVDVGEGRAILVPR